jgi:glycerophosphoryl diester phosphodiesterase
VELDAKLTADDAIVLMHDERLDRTTNGTGLVREYTYEELQRLDAGSWFDAKFRGAVVPSLDAAMALCGQLDLAVNVELKPCAGRERDTGRLVADRLLALRGENRPRPLLSSFSEEALHAARSAAPELPRALLVQDIPTDWRARLDAVGAQALHCSHQGLMLAAAEAVTHSGTPLAVYTVDDPKRARQLFERGVCAIVTDNLLAPRFTA